MVDIPTTVSELTILWLIDKNPFKFINLADY